MHLHLIERSAARSFGLRRYFTGEPCGRGGVAQRTTSSKDCHCTACCEDRKLRKSAHYEKYKDKYLAETQARYRADPDRHKQAASVRYQNNKPRHRANAKAWRLANPEQDKQYRLANADKIQERDAKRRAVMRSRLPPWFGELDRLIMKEAVSLARLRKDATGIDWHVDHMVPLQGRSASGLHCGKNLQVIPAALNTKKGNRLWLHEPDAWLLLK